ncbi:MAG: histone deacetylase [Bacteroidota bacterium]|nr:histone deacetylase [Bacteroidota bacterium]
MQIAWAPIYVHPLPDGHRFPMLKYELLPKQLLHEGIVSESQIFAPMDMDISIIRTIHTEEYIASLKNGSITKNAMRKIGFPYSYSVYIRELCITYGSIQAALLAIKYGIAFNIAGGTHHAYAASGEGFCIFNDIAVTSKYLLDNRLANSILVIDLDVHQGNGTAKIFENENRVFTFSMHGQNNYPSPKEKSDLDIGLADGTTDEIYLQELKSSLTFFKSKPNPDFLIFQTGVDILATDKLGKLSISMDGLKQRNEMVLNYAYLLKIPILCVMGGGYSEEISVILNAHAQLFRTASNLYD